MKVFIYKYDKILISSFTSNLCGFFGVGKRNPKWMGFLSTARRAKKLCSILLKKNINIYDDSEDYLLISWHFAVD